MKQKSIQDFFKCFTDSPVFKKGRNVDSVPMEESLCLQLESSLEESPVFKRKNSQANSPSLDKVTSLTPDVIRVVRRSNSVQSVQWAKRTYDPPYFFVFIPQI